jgi:hypothetical protein
MGDFHLLFFASLPGALRLGSGATSPPFLTKGPPDATQSLWQVRALDLQGMGKSSAMAQEPTHTIRPASCRCRPIAVSFHRLFLGGLLPSRARFRFAGYAHGISSVLTRQAHANSHTERSPLDSAHISCRLVAIPKPAERGHTQRGHRPPRRKPERVRTIKRTRCPVSGWMTKTRLAGNKIRVSETFRVVEH